MKKPFTIGIAGAHSKAGKTTLAVALLKHLTSGSNLFFNIGDPPRRKRWGAIKYTKTAFYSSIVDDKAIISQKDKDTKRFLDAGAGNVLWVQSPPEGLKEVLPIAISRLSHLDGIIIEGNSAIEFLRPDIVIFLLGASIKKIKSSAQTMLSQADIIISKDKSQDISGSFAPYCLNYDCLDETAIQKLMNCIEIIAKKRKLQDF